MRRHLEAVILILVLGATAAAASDRLAVFEFFGRTTCGNCAAASETIVVLQDEYAGRAVFLEYDYDTFWNGGRIDRFLESEPTAQYLPLMMVGCGYQTSSGSVNFDPVYRGMVEDELARPPRAEVSAYWRQVGTKLRVYVEVENTQQEYLEVDNSAAVWVIAFESPPSVESNTETFVMSAAQWSLPHDLGPGETITGIIDSPWMDDAQWDRMHGLVLVEDRPGCGCAEYDMLQAAEALPAGLTAVPDLVVAARSGLSTEVDLEGPYLLSWTAAGDVPWVEVTPSSGDRLTPFTVTVRDDLRPPSESEATVTIDASGDGMAFTETIEVVVGGVYRRAGQRLSPVETKAVKDRTGR